MYFDYAPRKYILISVLLAVLLGLVTVTALWAERNAHNFVLAGDFAARMRADLYYDLRFKLPQESMQFLASAFAAAPGPDAAAQAAPAGPAKSVPVLLYHGEGPAAPMPTSVFVAQLRALKAAGWHTITLAQFTDFMKGTGTVPAKSFLLTFDDGRTDTFYAADPVLKDLGYTAVMFVITGLSLPNNSDQAVNNFYLTKDELAYMAKSGRWELESHGDQDHRSYTIPSSVSIGSTTPMIGDQHFLSNLFWIPQENRRETPAEYTQRIRTDLSTAQNLLETDFGKPVTAFAYPFNDFGQETVNFPEAGQLLNQVVRQYYAFSFYQTWAGNGDSFNYPNPNLNLIKRIEPGADWTGEYLISVLAGGEAKSLPYTVTTFGPDWNTNWGTVTTGNTLTLEAKNNTTGAAAFLNGTQSWDNYTVHATSTTSVGTLGLMARYTSSSAPYAVCAFANDRIYLEQHLGQDQTTLTSQAYAPPPLPSTRSATMSVQGDTVRCSSYGVSVEAAIPGMPAHGGVGTTVWDPTEGAAKTALADFSVTPL